MKKLISKFSSKTLSDLELKSVKGGNRENFWCGKCTDDTDYLCSIGTPSLPGDSDCNCLKSGLGTGCTF